MLNEAVGLTSFRCQLLVLGDPAFQTYHPKMAAMEKDANKPPSVIISPSFLYGVRAGVKVGSNGVTS